MSKIFILSCFLFIYSLGIQAQTFKAGLILGVTASQINGDADAGFNKPGIEGGIKSLVNLSEKTDLSLEILYSQRGSKEEARADGQVQDIYRIDYVAVPVIFSFKDWEDINYYRLHFHTGLSYGRLIKAELDNEVDNTEFVEEWRENDLSVLVGATYFANEHLGFTFRYNRSLILLYKNDGSGNNRDSLLPYNLSLHVLYMF